MEVFTRINGVLSALLCLSFAYQIVYLLAALLVRERPLPQAAPRRYAALTKTLGKEQP